MANCCVCGKSTDIVCSSPFGAYSQAWCRDHLDGKIHPYDDIVGIFWEIGANSLEDINSDLHDDINNSLRYHNKTIIDVNNDVKVF